MIPKQQQVVTEVVERVGVRPVPFTGLSITATASGSAQTFATASGQGAMLVRQLSVVNITGAAATLSLHAVPDGGAIDNNNAQLVDYAIAANTAIDLTDIVGGFYTQGATLQAWSDTSGALTLSGRWDDIA